MKIVATCAKGLEPLLARELGVDRWGVGAVEFEGEWPDVWRVNRTLRTANRVLVELAGWRASNENDLYLGALKLGRRSELLHPDLSFAIHGTASASNITDGRFAALKVKDGLCDGQRDRHGSRSDIDREAPDLGLRLRLHRNRATLLLDTSGKPLDRRGYRLQTTEAPARESLAAACALAAEDPGTGPILDPMCGSGTLLAEAGMLRLGWAPRRPDRTYAFATLPTYDAELDRVPARPSGELALMGMDRDPLALRAAERNLAQASLSAQLVQGDAFSLQPPAETGLLLVNPPYGERLARADMEGFDRMICQTFRRWRRVVLIGGEEVPFSRSPDTALEVFNGPLRAWILVFQ